MAKTSDVLIRDVPDELIAKLDKLSEKEGRSRPKEIIKLIEVAVKDIE
ncbi:MAG: ribbon-helix-helix protein, CopG family [Candidatus Micrarchaeota archaeon]|nr:ribbon-helix-helix protein, CopG family [Candidatus Micrarchaeota archaeon]